MVSSSQSQDTNSKSDCTKLTDECGCGGEGKRGMHKTPHLCLSSLMNGGAVKWGVEVPGKLSVLDSMADAVALPPMNAWRSWNPRMPGVCPMVSTGTSPEGFQACCADRQPGRARWFCPPECPSLGGVVMRCVLNYLLGSPAGWSPACPQCKPAQNVYL